MKKKKVLKYSKHRVVLSDTLPYETPIIFSNRHFYQFLTKFGINYHSRNGNNNDSLQWKAVDKSQSLVSIIKLIFDTRGEVIENRIKLSEKEHWKIPFTYRITHKESDFRELSIPHPKNQIELICFYDEYKELILYYSKQSPFSIRKADSIAKFIYVKDSLHNDLKGDCDDLVEDSSKEYESLKTFFTYKQYPNIYKFYEDYHYHRAEKKYNKMFKFDIARCFDSVYTHSVAWAIYNKEIVKDKTLESKLTFAGRFDRLMQNVNYGETNGIIIGPEFSRIFSELILQQIDKSIEHKLQNEGLLFKKDYEIYRYVDDFFVFYNDDLTRDKILSSYKLNLKEYKLSINELKTKFYEKPLITDLTIAKERIITLFDQQISFKLERPTAEGGDLTDLCFANSLFAQCDSNRLITKFKIIIKETGVEYKDIMNFSLALLNNRIRRNIEIFESHYSIISREEYDSVAKDRAFPIAKKEQRESIFINYLLEMLDFTFFLYTVSPRVNSTVKLSTILSQIVTYVKGNYKFSVLDLRVVREQKIKKQFATFPRFTNINIQLIFKKISDDISLVLEKNSLQEFFQLETMYLLVVLRELGKEYRLSKDQIAKYFKLEPSTNDVIKSDSYLFTHEPNYFTIITLLFYIKNIKTFSTIMSCLKMAIIEKINKIEPDKRRKSAEGILLLLDLLVCPFLDNKFKRELLEMFGVPLEDHDEVLHFKNKQKYWFTKWDNFNLAEELQSKIATEPYS